MIVWPNPASLGLKYICFWFFAQMGLNKRKMERSVFFSVIVFRSNESEYDLFWLGNLRRKIHFFEFGYSNSWVSCCFFCDWGFVEMIVLNASFYIFVKIALQWDFHHFSSKMCELCKKLWARASDLAIWWIICSCD